VAATRWTGHASSFVGHAIAVVNPVPDLVPGGETADARGWTLMMCGR
jgi:hypothetical protein